MTGEVAAKAGNLPAPVGPPDGGYGWVICFGNFLMWCGHQGLIFSFGTLFPFLLEDFNSTRGTTSMVQATQMLCQTMNNPLVGGYVAKFGHQRVHIVGAVGTFTAVMASSFAPSVGVMIFTYGV